MNDDRFKEFPIGSLVRVCLSDSAMFTGTVVGHSVYIHVSGHVPNNNRTTWFCTSSELSLVKWTHEKRLEAISKLAFNGFREDNCEYYWVIGMFADMNVTNETIERTLDAHDFIVQILNKK
jgi:hypothetical protein